MTPVSVAYIHASARKPHIWQFRIPNSVTSIGMDAFKGCRSLTSIIIPSSVTTISGNALEDCSGLKTVAFLPQDLDSQDEIINSIANENVQLVYAYGYKSEDKSVVDLNEVAYCERALVYADKFSATSSEMQFQLKEYGTSDISQIIVTDNAGEEITPDESEFYNVRSGSVKISYVVRDGEQYNDVSYVINNPYWEFDDIEEVLAISTTEALQVKLRENPVSGATAWLKVAGASAANVDCRLTSINGSTIAISTVEADGQWQPLEIKAAPGLYLLTISDNRTLKTLRLIVR